MERVLLAIYDSGAEAHLALGLLRSHGIDAEVYVPGRGNPTAYRGAMSADRRALHVPPEDLEAAHGLLAEVAAPDDVGDADGVGGDGAPGSGSAGSWSPTPGPAHDSVPAPEPAPARDRGRVGEPGAVPASSSAPLGSVVRAGAAGADDEVARAASDPAWRPDRSSAEGRGRLLALALLALVVAVLLLARVL